MTWFRLVNRIFFMKYDGRYVITHRLRLSFVSKEIGNDQELQGVKKFEGIILSVITSAMTTIQS